MKKTILMILLICSNFTLSPTISLVVHRPYYVRPAYYGSPIFYAPPYYPYYLQSDLDRFIMSMCALLNCCMSDYAYKNKHDLKVRGVLVGTTLLIMAGICLGVSLLTDSHDEHNQYTDLN